MTYPTARANPRALILAFALASAPLIAPAHADEVTVRIDNFAFVPDTVTIRPGDVVTWKNADDIPHSIVSAKPGAFRSKALDTDDTFTFAFPTAGAYEYFCGLHPHMKGKIVVAP